MHKYIYEKLFSNFPLSFSSLCPSVEDMRGIPEESLVCFSSSLSEFRFMGGEMGSTFI